jgi:hypothetical protein
LDNYPIDLPRWTHVESCRRLAGTSFEPHVSGSLTLDVRTRRDERGRRLDIRAVIGQLRTDAKIR